MYFSGHMIDNFSNHISSLKSDKIPDIVNSLENIENGTEEGYRDGDTVKVCGIITAKKTKTLKNGQTMAFISLEDRLAEIEVIVFARQYEKFSSELFEEAAVIIDGKISYEDSDSVKIILSRVESLKSNTELSSAPSDNDREASKLFIKVEKLDEKTVAPIFRLANLNSGKCSVVLFDSSSNKYTTMKNVTINPSDKVIERLKNLYGEKSVVIK